MTALLVICAVECIACLVAFCLCRAAALGDEVAQGCRSGAAGRPQTHKDPEVGGYDL